MGVPEKSYSSKEPYPYFNNQMDPVYDFPKIILYFINDLPPPWHNPKIKIYKCSFNYARKKSFTINITKNRYCMNIGRQHKRQNIYFIIYPEMFGFKQKCLDCSRYDSKLFNIPAYLFFTTLQEKTNLSYLRQRHNII